jgi:hypothetical protein
MSQAHLYQLTFPGGEWPSISPCLTSKTVPGNPYPEIVPIPMGKNYILIVGGQSRSIGKDGKQSVRR